MNALKNVTVSPFYLEKNDEKAESRDNVDGYGKGR